MGVGGVGILYLRVDIVVKEGVVSDSDCSEGQQGKKRGSAKVYDWTSAVMRE